MKTSPLFLLGTCAELEERPRRKRVDALKLSAIIPFTIRLPIRHNYGGTQENMLTKEYP